MRTVPTIPKASVWLRVVLASVLLSFAINSVAHSAHRHDTRTTAAHIATCGYHATFGALGTAPQYSIAVEAITTASISLPIADCVRPACGPQIVAQPRAPPVR